MNRPEAIDEKEIRISEEQVQKAGWGFAVIAVLFIIIGFFVSPVDDLGKPILLLPDVKAVKDYRQTGISWVVEMKGLDGEIASILDETNTGDLFSRSRAAQTALQHAVSLAQEIDQSEVPAVGVGIHEQFIDASIGYLEAARYAMQWISTPQDDIRANALLSLEQARGILAELEQNQWIATQ
jgi:hypothetical protein